MGSVGPQTTDCDVLIVGAGIFGTSTAYHLSLTHPNPSRIVVLDRAPFPSPEAASSDINKIVRADYSSAFYMDLAFEAMDAWSSWEFLKPFYHRTGWVALDETKSDLSERIRKNFRDSGRPDPSEDISLEEVKTRWDGVLSGINTTDYSKAYTNPTAGWCDASLAIEAMMKEATKRGVRYEVGEVDGLIGGEHGLFGVKTSDDRTFCGRKTLLATGAWTPWLMAPLEESLEFGEDDSIDRQISTAGVCVAAFTLSSDKEAEHYGKLPILVYGSQGEVMPVNRDRMFKFTNANTFTNTIAHPCGRQVSVPAPAPQNLVPQALKDESVGIIRNRVPQILEKGRLPDYWRLCWDTVSPDQNQLICQHPDARLSNLYLATAGSFHSWKFLPTIGKYVVNVLNGKSNGKSKDDAWKWKTEWNSRGAHGKVLPRGELRRFDEDAL